MTDNATYQWTCFLTAPRCNAQSELSVAALTADLIEVATAHANSLGIGYTALLPEGIAWVLSRLAIQMDSYPQMHQTDTITTWVESFTRNFSERRFTVTDTATGRVLGYARSVWTAIDIKARNLGDLSHFIHKVPLAPGRECPVATRMRIPMPDESTAVTRTYKFNPSDIDFNRHVNTVRYVEMIINNRTLADYDRYLISRLELSFRHEAVYGQTAQIIHDPEGNCCIRDTAAPHTPFVQSTATLTPRPTSKF